MGDKSPKNRLKLQEQKKTSGQGKETAHEKVIESSHKRLREFGKGKH